MTFKNARNVLLKDLCANRNIRTCQTHKKYSSPSDSVSFSLYSLHPFTEQNRTADRWSERVLLTHVWERGAEWGKAQPRSTARRPTRLLLHDQPADLSQSSDSHWPHCGLYQGHDMKTQIQHMEKPPNSVHNTSASYNAVFMLGISSIR